MSDNCGAIAEHARKRLGVFDMESLIYFLPVKRAMANWVKLLYVLVIALLYVPMVFLGANVFFPEFTGTEAHFKGFEECDSLRYPGPPVSEEVRTVEQAEYEQCMNEKRAEQKAWDDERKVYNGWKYTAITGFNLLILLLIVFIAFADAVSMGIFFGTVATAFIATVSYWEYARTKIGFILMLVTFFAVLLIVNKRTKTLIESKSKKK